MVLFTILFGSGNLYSLAIVYVRSHSMLQTPKSTKVLAEGRRISKSVRYIRKENTLVLYKSDKTCHYIKKVIISTFGVVVVVGIVHQPRIIIQGITSPP